MVDRIVSWCAAESQQDADWTVQAGHPLCAGGLSADQPDADPVQPDARAAGSCWRLSADLQHVAHLP